jgi:hypothetical protein
MSLLGKREKAMFSDKVSASFQMGLLGVSLAISVGLNIFQTKALIDVRRVSADLRQAADLIQMNSYNSHAYNSTLEAMARERGKLREAQIAAMSDGL